MNNQFKTKCSFCKYATRGGCMVTPNSFYCKEAFDEYQRNLKYPQKSAPIKSLRKWDRK